jgi:TonB family protein
MITLWMLAATAFALLLGVAALAAERVQRARRGATRGVWFAALAAAVLWPVLVPVLRHSADAVPARTGVSTSVAPTNAVVTEESMRTPWGWTVRRTLDQLGTRATRTLTRLESGGLGTALLGAWALATLLLLARLGRTATQLRAATHGGTRAVVDGEPVLLSETFGPATVGWRTPQIVLPAWVTTLDAPLRALVVAHERAHREARDPRLVWAAAVATALVPWNVGVWWLARRLRLAVELDCDARTLAAARTDAWPGGSDAAQRTYARLLLFVAQHVPTSAGATRPPSTRLASAMASSRSHLHTRIRTMPQLFIDPAAPRARRQRLAFGSVALLAVAAACGTHIPGNLTSVTPVNARAGEGVTVAEVSPGANSGGMPIAETGVTPAPMPNLADATPPLLPEPAASADHYLEFQVEQPATMRGAANLTYPAMLRSAQVEGTVLASFVVDTDGRPDATTFRVLRSDHDLFAHSVRTALERMRYEPARVGGRAVRQLVQQPFAFSLARAAADPARAVPEGSVHVTAVTPNAPPRPAAPSRPDGVYFEYQVEQPAAMRGSSGTVYPAALRAAGVEGTVLVSFVVDEQGAVDMGSFRVLRSDHEAFTDAVRQALPGMTYVPAEVDGARVKQLVQQPFVFNLAK